MKRFNIIKNYKKFFGYEDNILTEDDILNIDWAESLLKDYDKAINVTHSSLQLKETYKKTIVELEQDLKEWDKLNDEGKLNNEKWLRHHAFIKGQLSVLYNL